MRLSNSFIKTSQFCIARIGSISKVFCFAFFFFNCVQSHFAQNVSTEKSFQDDLVSIERNIELNDYDKAFEQINKLEANSNFVAVEENRLNLDLKKAKIYFGRKEQGKAMNILLTNLNKLGEKKENVYFKKYVNYLGNIFKENKNYERAHHYYHRGLDRNLEVEDSLGIIKSYFLIGMMYAEQEDDDNSILNFKKVISFPITFENEDLISDALIELSAIAMWDDDYKLATEYGERSLLIEKRQNDTIGKAQALFNLSGIYYRKKEFEKAKQSYLDIYWSVENLSSPEVIGIKVSTLYNLSYVNEELKDFEKAYFYLLDATELTDSLSKAKGLRNISEIEAKYNVQKAAKEAEEEKSRRQRTQFFFYAAIFAFISVLVLSYIFYRNFRLKREMEVDKLVNDSQIKIINATIDAKENERKSIAEILHDSVSALLSSANLHLQAAKAQLKTGYPQEIVKAQTIVNEASVKIRDLMMME